MIICRKCVGIRCAFYIIALVTSWVLGIIGAVFFTGEIGALISISSLAIFGLFALGFYLFLKRVF